NAHYHGNYGGGGIAIAMAHCAHGGYWITNTAGQVYSLGGASYHGGSPTLSNGEFIMDIESTSTGNGYWLVGNQGSVFSYGDATYHGGMFGHPLNGAIVAMARNFDDDGYWLVGNDGGVFSFGTAKFWGSLPEDYAFSTTGNYKDYTDIVIDLLLWSGWWR